MMTDGTTGAPVAFHDYLPFGEEIQAGIGGRSALYDLADPKQKFTGKERDQETGLDFFGARYLSSAQGRFTGPDTPLLDQHPEDPQSWNLYAYVRNNPLATRDFDGHQIDCSGDNAQKIGCQTLAKWNAEHGLVPSNATIGPMPETTSRGQTQDRITGAVKGFFGGLLDLAEAAGAPRQNVDQVKDFLHLWPASKNQEFGGEAFGILLPLLPGGQSKGAEEIGILASDGTRITGFTRHAVERLIGDTGERAGTKPQAILDALKNPEKIVAGVDPAGRASKVFYGRDARVVVNPQTGNVVTVYPVSGAGAH